MIHNKFRYLLTLVALFAISTGAWAQETPLVTITFDSNGPVYSVEGLVTLTGTNYHLGNSSGVYFWEPNSPTKTLSATVEAVADNVSISKVVFRSINDIPLEDTEKPFVCYANYDLGGRSLSETDWTNKIASERIAKIEVYAPAAEASLTVDWDATTKTGTFSMPGSDVVLTPQYAPAAQLDENGAPAAVSGLEIAADAAIITAGQSAQGTLLYAVGTSATEKPALTAFAATLPNAKDQTAAGNYYVWYYIQGQDTPQGQEPTAENTFNDSEIMGPVMVELLTNEHTLNIKQSPNITVTVAGTAVTPTDDKVTPVTTGQEVKIKAKEGYKFRKVEVKKGAAGPKYTDKVTMCEKNGDGKYLVSSFFDGTNANITTITKEEAIALAEYLGGGNIRVVYEEYEFYGDRYVRATNAAGNAIGVSLETTNTSTVPLYYVPAGN